MDKPIKYSTQNGSIRYRISYYYKDNYGRTRRSSKGGFLTSKEAKAFGREKEEELSYNAARQAEKLTVGNLLNMWLEIVELQVKPNTYSFYRYMCKHLIELYEVRIVELTPQILERYYYDIIKERSLAHNKKELSITTIKHINRVLGIALTYAVKNGLIHKNVAQLVRLPAAKSYEYHWYTMQELVLLNKLIVGTYIEWPVRLSCMLGLRRGEVVALRWKDISFEDKICSISRNIVCIDGECIESTPKTKYGIRNIPLSQNILIALKTLKEAQKDRLSKNGLTQDEETFVCLTPYFTAYNPDYLTEAFRKFLKTIGKENGLHMIRFHDLRHSFASIAIYECGIAPELVSKMLGHATSSFTIDIYGHPSNDAQSIAAEKFSNKFNSFY